MKKISRFLLIAAFAMMIFSTIDLLLADPPAPPSVPGGHGYGDNIPSGAPIDGGLGILLGLGLGYGAKVFLKAGKKDQ
jgi:hypothetical protein